MCTQSIPSVPLPQTRKQTLTLRHDWRGMTAPQRRLSLDMKGSDTYIVRVKDRSLPKLQRNVVSKLNTSLFDPKADTRLRPKSSVERISQNVNRTMPVIGDHRTILDGCQLLEMINKLKDQNSFTNFSANDILSVNQKSEELLRVLRIRCKFSIRDDSFNRVIKANDLIRDLRELYFEDNYKLNAIKSNKSDDRKKVKVTDSFVKSCSARKNLCEDIDHRSTSWVSMMTNANRLLNVTHINLTDDGLELVVQKTVRRLKFLRFCAICLLRNILKINCEIMTLLIDCLPFESISQMCYSVNNFNKLLVCDQIKPLDVIPIVAINRANVTTNKFLYYLYNEVNKSLEVVKRLPPSSSGQTEEITSDYFSASSMSTTTDNQKNKSELSAKLVKDSKIVFNILIQSNQRILLKLIFGNNPENSDRNQLKTTGMRQKWFRSDTVFYDNQQRVCQQLDKQFWEEFWLNFNQSMISSLCFCEINTLSVPISCSYNPSKVRTIKILLEGFARDEELLDEAVDSLQLLNFNLLLRHSINNYGQNYHKFLKYKSKSIVSVERREANNRTGTVLGQSLLDCVEPFIGLKVKYKPFINEFDSIVDTIVANILQIFVSFVESKQSSELEFKLLDLIALSVLDINNLIEFLTLYDSKSMSDLIKTLVGLKKNTTARVKKYVYTKSFDLISKNIPVKQFRRKICSSNSQWIESIIKTILEPINDLLKSDSSFETNILNSSLIEEFSKAFVKCVIKSKKSHLNFSHSGAVQFHKDVNTLWDWIVNNGIQSTDSDSITRLKSFSFSLVNKDIPITTSVRRHHRIRPELNVHQSNQTNDNQLPNETNVPSNLSNCISFLFCGNY